MARFRLVEFQEGVILEDTKSGRVYLPEDGVLDVGEVIPPASRYVQWVADHFGFDPEMVRRFLGTKIKFSDGSSSRHLFNPINSPFEFIKVEATHA